MAEAAGRGAAVRVHRLGRAGPSLAQGRGDPDDMLARVLVSSARLGCYPVHPRLAFAVLPVDVMARSLVALSGTDLPPGAVHHLHPSGGGPGLAQLMAAHDRRFGTTTPAVDLADWVDRLAAATPLPATVYRDHLRELVTGPAGTVDVHDDSATRTALADLGIPPPDLDAAYLDRCWTGLTGDLEVGP